MTRVLFLAGIFLASFASSVAFASLYLWNDYKRPPIRLDDALVRAEKLLANDAANYYCVGVSLYGDEGGTGKSGAWNLYFAAKDGSRKLVYVDMKGEGAVRPFDGPGDFSKRKKPEPRADLDDLRQRIDELFRTKELKPAIALKDGVLLVQLHVREFQVHPVQQNGDFAVKPETVVGPRRDGVWLRAVLSDHADFTRYAWSESQYWRVSRGSYLTTHPNRVLVVEMRHGGETPQHLLESLEELFGPHVPSPREGGFQ